MDCLFTYYKLPYIMPSTITTPGSTQEQSTVDPTTESEDLGTETSVTATNKFITDLTAEEALDYFMRPESFCSIDLPEYFDFTEILNYVREVVDKKGGVNFKSTLGNISRSKTLPESQEGVNYTLLVNKNARFAFRPLQIPNPFLYYILAKVLTTDRMEGAPKNNWDYICERLNKKDESRIKVISIPPVIADDHSREEQRKLDQNTNNDEITPSSQAIHNWWESFEQASISLSLTYKYMFVTDITNCYGSIYTHSITWALAGKKKGKLFAKGTMKSTDSDFYRCRLGDSLDKLVQKMQYGQTNGIPQGGVLFDLIAELVLTYADERLEETLSGKDVKDYYILRYRDDIRVFSNSREDIDKISMSLHEILAELNFQMNSSKTKLTEEIVLDAIKPDKLYYLSGAPITQGRKRSLFSNLQKELYYILAFAKKFPNSGMLRRLLDGVSGRITRKALSKEYPTVLMAILTEIVLYSPTVHQYVMLCMSRVLDAVGDDSEKENLVKAVAAKLKRIPNIGHLQIWLQRVSINLMMDEPLTYDEKLCDIVEIYGYRAHSYKAFSVDETPWNLSWLKKEIVDKFPIDTMINREKLDNISPVMKKTEVSPFGYWSSMSYDPKDFDLSAFDIEDEN